MSDVSLVPVDHQPDFEDVSLVPVDHDPFSDSGPIQQAPTQLAQLPIQSPQTQPQTQPAQPELQTQAQQSATGANRPGVNGAATSSTPGGSSGAGVGNAGIDLGNLTSDPGSASGSASSSFGKGLLQATINAVVPGAYYSNLAQQQFRQGNYGAATVYGVAALGDAALGAATLGANTRLGTGIRAAETLVPATTEGAGLGRALTDAVPRSPASRAARKGYSGIGTTPNGGPTFVGTDHLYPAGEGQRGAFKMPLTGSRRADVDLANEMGGFTETPAGYRWHHVDDFDPQTGMSTLELVKKEAHEATYPHAGSVSQWEKFHGRPYKR